MNIYNNPTKDVWPEISQRPKLETIGLKSTIKEIFTQVQNFGDEALRNFSVEFDRVELNSVKVDANEIDLAENYVDDDLKKAIQTAKQNIEKFHLSQLENNLKIETSPELFCWRESRGIEKVGLYIPGGSAPLFSTVLMLAIPAKIAGCKEIILCTPPSKDGSINPIIAYTAKLCGIKQIFKVGGAQAVAAMTFGTESIPKVYKIFGPGNQFVTCAKEYATELGVSIDMPAGPSEVLIIADEDAIPEFCAADLLAQAEHGPDSQVVFVTDSQKILEKTMEEVDTQLKLLPRADVAQKALESSRFLWFSNLDDAFEFSNFYAPEHLIVATKNAEKYTSKIQNAGSVFLGNFACESAGDYASGTNHTLPTNGNARMYSGVSVDSFVKKITFQTISEMGIQNLGPMIELMAEAEGLQAHKNAVSLRLNFVKEKL